MTARVSLTFVPLILLHNLRSKKWLRLANEENHPRYVKKKEEILRNMRNRTVVFHILIFIPLVLYWATIIASLERTPLTGRYAAFLLSRPKPSLPLAPFIVRSPSTPIPGPECIH